MGKLIIDADKQSIADAIISKYDFPDIEGVSENQIKYARDLRIKYLSEANIEKLIEQYDSVNEKLKDEKLKTDTIKPLADKKFNGDLDKALDHLFKVYGLDLIDKIRHESRASKIIDALQFHGKSRIC